MKHLQTAAWVVVFGLIVGASGQTQEPAAPSSDASRTRVPLQADVVVSRYQGEKKVSSLPYTIRVNAVSRTTADRWTELAQLRMGAEVPVPLMAPPTVNGKPLAEAVPGVPTGGSPVHYKAIGTNIDCMASILEDGRFRLEITIEESSVYTGVQRAPDTPGAGDLPVFRSFRSSSALILKDGQSTQVTAATDRVSGEVIRIDVTLNVMK